MKASILLRQHTDWVTAEILSVSKGLRNAHVVAFRCPNFALVPDLLKLIRVAKLSSEFGQAAFLSFLLILRVPSGTLQMRQAGDSDPITEVSPRAFKVLVARPTRGGYGHAHSQIFLAGKLWARVYSPTPVPVRRILLSGTGLLSRSPDMADGRLFGHVARIPLPALGGVRIPSHVEGKCRGIGD